MGYSVRKNTYYLRRFLVSRVLRCLAGIDPKLMTYFFNEKKSVWIKEIFLSFPELCFWSWKLCFVQAYSNTCLLSSPMTWCNCAMYFREWSGTTRSSWSAVNNSNEGYWAPFCGILILCRGEYLTTSNDQSTITSNRWVLILLFGLVNGTSSIQVISGRIRPVVLKISFKTLHQRFSVAI